MPEQAISDIIEKSSDSTTACEVLGERIHKKVTIGGKTPTQWYSYVQINIPQDADQAAIHNQLCRVSDLLSEVTKQLTSHKFNLRMTENGKRIIKSEIATARKNKQVETVKISTLKLEQTISIIAALEAGIDLFKELKIYLTKQLDILEQLNNIAGREVRLQNK